MRFLNICHEYAGWLPPTFLKSGLKKLPGVLKVEPGQLDTVTVLAQSPVAVLLVAGGRGQSDPAGDRAENIRGCRAGKRVFVVPEATHEALPYYFDDLARR